MTALHALVVDAGATFTCEGDAAIGSLGHDLVVTADLADFQGTVYLGASSSDTLTVNAVATFTSPVVLEDTVSALDNMTFGAGASLIVGTGGITNTGATELAALTVTGNAVLGHTSGSTTLDVQAPTSFARSITIADGAALSIGSGGLNVTGGAGFAGVTNNGNTIMNGTLTVSAGITSATGCSIPKRVYVWAADADYAADWATANLIIIPSSVITTTRTLTLATSGIPDGAGYMVVALDTNATHLVNVALDYPSGTYAMGYSSGHYRSLNVGVYSEDLYVVDSTIV
jgi:hypothetical protein